MSVLNSMVVMSELEDELSRLLSSTLAQIPTSITREPGSGNDLLIDLPDADTVDHSLEELASLVARTSNAYVRAARLAGIARAEYKLAKGRFDRKYKRSRAGRNDAERDANAMEACEDEHAALTAAEAIAELADSLEHGARVASESIRKIFGSAQHMSIGSARESVGILRDQDYSSTW